VPQHSQMEELKEQIESLNSRLTLLEKAIITAGSKKTAVSSADEKTQQEEDWDISVPFKSENSIEFGIGQYGMAWLGNLILLITIVFFVQHLHKTGQPLLSAFAGILAVAGIYTISFFSNKSYPYLSKLFRYSGQLLLFYLSVRLHFVQDPILENRLTGIVILAVIIAVFYYLSYKNTSQLLTGMTLSMMLAAGILSNFTHLILFISVLTAGLSVYNYYRFDRIKLLIVFIFLTYFVQFSWLLNNPFINQVISLRSDHEYYFIYLIVTGLIFSLPAVIPQKEKISREMMVFALAWNGIGFTVLLVVSTFTFLTDNFAYLYALISLVCLLYSVLIYSRSALKASSAIYAVYGFMALSVAIYGIFLLPRAYTLLSVQSFLVVSMALWFRSQFIVIANTLMYLLLLLLYVKDPINYHSANISFMLVAFITARLINIKKDRLQLKTDMLRNLYLICGFIMTLITFHHLVSSSWATVSWIFAAVLFLILSVLLKNIKYRWLAITALVASAGHLLIVDLSNNDILTRILVFLLFAVIAIAVSVLYTKFLIQKKEQ
jgi:hypothetical protein